MATITVGTGKDYTNLQDAIDAAERGDILVLDAGTTFVGNFDLPYKGAGTEYITIQSSALASLPAEGNRVSPSDAFNMPTIRANLSGGEPPISAFPATNPPSYYKFIGIQIRRSLNNTSLTQGELVRIGYYGASQDSESEVPHHFIFDRCLLRGEDNYATRCGFYFYAQDSKIINCYIDNIWETGGDNQAIFTANGGERCLVANNFIEAGSENMMIGEPDPDIIGFVPNNWTIEHNHFFKRLAWDGISPPRTVKNLFEIKCGRDIIIRNNIFENNWFEAQAGYAILFTPRSQGTGTAPQTVVENVTFEYNIIKNVCRGFNITRTDDSNDIQLTNNITVSNNLWIIAGTPLGDTGRLGIFPDAGNLHTSGAMSNIIFDHNTFITTSNSESFLWVENPDTPVMFENFQFTNNIIACEASSAWSGVRNASNQTGLTALNQFAPDSQWTWEGNATQIGSSNYPSNNEYAASFATFDFIDPATENYKLSNSSPYKGIAAGGLDVGVNWDELMSRTQNVEAGTNYSENGGGSGSPSSTVVLINSTPISIGSGILTK